MKRIVVPVIAVLALGGGSTVGGAPVDPEDDAAMAFGQESGAELVSVACTVDPSGAPITCYGLNEQTSTLLVGIAQPGEAFTFFTFTESATSGGTPPNQSGAVPAPTMAAGLSAVDQEILTIGEDLNANKPGFVELLMEASSLIDTVDLVNWDSATATLTIAVTTGFNGTEYHDEAAWQVVSPLAGALWAANTFGNPAATIAPALDLTVDSSRYVASRDLMVQVADIAITSADWLAQSRR